MDTNYEELCRGIVINLSDDWWPGDKMQHYVAKKIRYINCKKPKPDRWYETPAVVLWRMQ